HLRSTEQACSFTMNDPSGGVRLLGLHGKRLPFALRALSKPLGAAHADGRYVQVKVRPKAAPDTVTLSCWVPTSMSAAELSEAAIQVDWSTMLARLLHAKLVTQEDIKRPLSREVKQFRYESLDPAPPPISLLRQSPPGAALKSLSGCTWEVEVYSPSKAG